MEQPDAITDSLRVLDETDMPPGPGFDQRDVEGNQLPVVCIEVPIQYPW